MLKKMSLLLTVFVAVAAPSFANESKRMYCSTEQIEIADQKIVVRLGDDICEVDALQVDQGGIYFNSDAARCIECRQRLDPRDTCQCPMS